MRPYICYNFKIMNRKYDVIFALVPQTADDKIDALISRIEKKITSSGGTITSISKKGMLRIATRMRKFKNIRDGYYVMIVFEGPSNIPNEISNILNVTETVMKHIITVGKIAPAPAEVKEKTEEAKVEINPEMLVGKSE